MFLLIPAGECSELYFAVGADGILRYASQPYDSSYVPVPSGSTGEPENKSRLPSTSRLNPNIKSLIERLATQYDVSVNLVYALIATESAFNPKAISPRGARGLMQVMPQTARDYGVTNPEQLFDPSINLEVGIRHLAVLMKRFQNNLPMAIAAYNAGDGPVYRGARIPPYRETLLHVAEVISRLPTGRTMTGDIR